jgi:outer membrane receptor protein involved in Fe transport
MHRRFSARPSVTGGAVLFLLLALPLFALDGRLVRSDGAPASTGQVSVVGRPGSIRADHEGLFVLEPVPPLPFTIVVTGDRGEIYPPVTIASLPADGVLVVRLQPGFQESVTVVSGVAPNVAASPAAATSVVGREDLEERAPQRLADVIQGTAGVSRSEESATAVPVVRGLDSGRTLILIDDARVVAERRAGASATFLDPFTLGSVEIARGPGSVAYGSDAFGGVIHARPRDPVAGDPGFRYETTLAAGATNERAIGVEGSTDLAGGAILGEFHMRQQGDLDDSNGDRIFDSSFRSRGAGLRWKGETPVGTLRVGLAWDLGHDLGKQAESSLTTRTSYPIERSTRFNLGLDLAPPPGWSSLELRAGYGGYRLVTEKHRYPADGTAERIESSDVDARDASLRLVGVRPIGSGRLEVGVDGNGRFGLTAEGFRQDFDSAGNPRPILLETAIESARRTDVALYALFDQPLVEKLHVSLGVRGDRVTTRNSGGYFGDHSVDHGALSGHLSLQAGPFGGLLATIQVARGFRDPLLSDRYYRGISGKGFIVGNPNLDPETSLQYDAGLRWSRNGFSAALFGYLYEIDDLIERYKNGNDYAFRNRGEAEIKGVELEIGAPLGHGFDLQLAAASARGKVKDDGSGMTNIAPPGGSATLRWAGASSFAWLRFSAWDRDRHPSSTELERPGYSNIDLGLGWRVAPALELRLLGTNLTNHDRRASADSDAAPAAGRAVSLGLVGRI